MKAGKHKTGLGAPPKENKVYFIEMMVFLILMIICIAEIVYTTISFFQSYVKSMAGSLSP